MADENRIFNGELKGVPIVIRSASINGGRRKAVKRFPSRDTQNVEDMGLIPREYSLEIIISDKTNEDYFIYRDRLMAEIETPESGILIHPLYGRIENIATGVFSLSETFEEFGYSTLIVQLLPDENTGIPQTSRNVITGISSQNDLVRQAVSESIENDFSINPRLPDSRDSALEKVRESLLSFEGAANFVGVGSDTINEFNSNIRNARNTINDLLGNPAQLALEIDSFFTSLRNIAPTAENALASFGDLFGFGSLDISLEQNTASRIERQRNNQTINTAINAVALSESYLAVAQIEFETERDLIAAREVLDDQFDLVIDSAIDLPVRNAITEMRIFVFDFLEEQRINASRLITVAARDTSVRLAAFDYYGNDDRGAQISSLNGISDVSFIDGDIEVITL